MTPCTCEPETFNVRIHIPKARIIDTGEEVRNLDIPWTFETTSHEQADFLRLLLSCAPTDKERIEP